MSFTEGQLKLAREVMGNFVATCPRGYWVHHVSIPTGDGEGDPETMIVWEDMTDGTADGYDLNEDDVAEAIVRILEDHLVNDRLEMVIRDMWDHEEYLGEMFSGGDFETDDVIVQVACFGEVVYG